MTIYTPHLSWQRNPLAYPAGYAPGFDPSHVGADAHCYSGVSSPGGFMRVSAGPIAIAAAGTAPSFKMHGVIGPGTNFATATTNVLRYDNISPKAFTSNGTLAAIFVREVAGNGYGSAIQVAYGGATLTLNWAGDGFLGIAQSQAGTNTTSSLPISLNTPYFAAASFDGTNCYFVLKNLATGAVRSATVAGVPTWTASTINWIFIGNNGNGNIPACGPIACAAVIWKTMSVPQLLQWSDDPWSFWYPNPGDNWIAAQASGFPYWGVQNNNFVIGTGIQ